MTREYTEVCPHCDHEVTLRRDIEKEGYKAVCPYCGQRLMLCDACQHRGQDRSYTGDCDYCTETDSCRFNPKPVRMVNYLLSVSFPTKTDAEQHDHSVQLIDEIVEEIELTETLREALDNVGVKYAIFSGADIDPAVLPKDIIEAYGQQETVEAVHKLKEFSRSLTKVSELELKHAINICLQIVAKAMHAKE